MTGPSLFDAPAGVSLREFTVALGNAIRTQPSLQGAWVRAELSDVRYTGGHCYMELVEKDERGATVAKLRANIWASTVQGLRRKFYGVTGRDIASGMKVLVKGSATCHQVYGLSFNIVDIDPSYTLGDMERLRREILMRLQREGVIGYNKSLTLPPAPQRLAVISAPGAAGYGDFISQLDSSPEGFVFYPVLFPAVMQGERTSESVRAALDLIEMSVDVWDCVVIIRGGGATTDLNGFDDYDLARRVATYPLPVLVGIGHERDRTVLDEIAHTRLKTPTAVANFLIDTLRQANFRAAAAADAIMHYVADRIAGEKQRLANCWALLPTLVRGALQGEMRHLDSMTSAVPMAVGARLASGRAALKSYATMVDTLARQKTAIASAWLHDAQARLRHSVPRIIDDARTRLDSYERLVRALSPDNTLRRGYSLTTVDGHAVTDAASLCPGQSMVTRFAQGSVTSVVADVASVSDM